jgi:hypothetical protein
MDQRTTIGASATLDGPIHKACVVPGCWCGSTTRNARTAPLATSRARGAPGAGPTTTNSSAHLTGIALRSVGLPVV